MPGFEQQEQNQVTLDVLLDAPRGQQRQHADKPGQHDQRQADAVDTQAVVDVPGRDPLA